MGTTATEPAPPVPRFRAAVGVVLLRSPFWDRTGKHRCVRVLLRLLYTYVVFVALLLCLENWLLFRGATASDSWAPPPKWCVVEDVALTSADGTPLHAWWLTGPGWRPENGALLFVHGNGGNLSHRAESVRFWVTEQHVAVLLIDYPGYGKSGGRATEAGCYAAADAGYDWLTDEQKVAPQRLLLYGGSLGGAVAVDLASRRPHRALILVSTFTTFPDIAQDLYPFFPARWLVRNKFDSLAKIRRVTGPVFVTHSDADTLIPFEMGQRLFAAANEPKQFVTMHGESHHDCGNAAAFAACAEFLEKHAP
jgi:pimeloyl-ACP methyl ester carboxylesterase